MPRPDHVDDPRDPDASVRVDDEYEDWARSRKTLRQLLQEAHEDPESAIRIEDDDAVTGLEEPRYDDVDLAGAADEEELRELRHRRDRILGHPREDPDGG